MEKRMRVTLTLLLFLGCLAAPALAQDVNIDYAMEFDFDKVKTFQYVETSDSNMREGMMDSRIKNGIISRLEAKGLKRVESDPDIYVTYHVTTQQNTVYNTSSFGYGGYGAGWHSWGASVGTSVTTPHTYIEGTLIIDAYEPTDKKLVWHGTGTVTVKDNPQKRTKQVEKILDKMAQKWAKILKKKGK